jgi:hypothetical protein
MTFSEQEQVESILSISKQSLVRKRGQLLKLREELQPNLGRSSPFRRKLLDEVSGAFNSGAKSGIRLEVNINVSHGID